MYMPMAVMAARKTYKVEFPNLYADKENANADKFNCVQVSCF